MWLYLCNQWSKQTNFVDLQFFFELRTFGQKLVQKIIKKGTSNMKVYYVIPLNYRFTRRPENFKMKLYYFQERLSLRYNIILKLLSLFHTRF